MNVAKYLFAKYLLAALAACLAASAATPAHANLDPIGQQGGMNLYEYVGSMPMSMIDPTGRTYIKNRKALPNGMPAFVNEAYNYHCSINCTVGHHYCKLSAVPGPTCDQWNNECLEYCRTLDAFRADSEKGLGDSVAWVKFLLATSALVASASDTSVDTIANTLKVSNRLATNSLRVFSGAMTLYGLYDSWETFYVVDRQIKKKYVQKHFRTKVSGDLDNVRYGRNPEARQAFGNVGTGSFTEGFLSPSGEELNGNTPSTYSKMTGFWINSCDATNNTEVLIYVDTGSGWIRTSMETDREPCKKTCFYADEIFRIEMYQNWQTHLANP